MKLRTAFRTREAEFSRTPLPPLQPYQRCTCGKCRECRENEKWDRIFAKFEKREDYWQTKGLFQSTLRGW